MGTESNGAIEAILARWRARDSTARDDLLQLTCERLRKLVGKMMQKYDRLHRWVDIDDVLQNSLVRLMRAMDEVQVKSVPDYFALAALQIRRELLDLCRHYFGPEGPAANYESAQLEPTRGDDPRPLRESSLERDDERDLLDWTDFHRLIDVLPVSERCVFELVWYHGMTQAEAALVLNMSEAKVKRVWLATREHIKKTLGKVKE